MSQYEFWTIIVLGVTALIFVIQTSVAVRSFRLDHDRRKKEATIHYMNDIRPKYQLLNEQLKKTLGSGVVDKKKIATIVKNDKLHNEVKDILGLFEHLAVGANTSVFDVDLLNRMSGKYLINIHDRYLPYFESRRKDTNNPRLYEEFSELVTMIKDIRNKKR
jgi:hypothetical protein